MGSMHSESALAVPAIVVKSRALQRKLSAAGVRFGPPGSKRLIYFIDDANMPLVDKYDTQSAIELIRQAVDYKGWYDKVEILCTLTLLRAGFFFQELPARSLKVLALLASQSK